MSNQRSEAVLDALGDPTRRRILERLGRGPLAVGELAGQLPVGRPAVSKHLRVLEGAGLVEHRAVGTRNLYALAPEGLVAAQRWLVETWDQTLAAFAGRVTERHNAEQHNAEQHNAEGRDPERHQPERHEVDRHEQVRPKGGQRDRASADPATGRGTRPARPRVRGVDR